MIEVYDIEVLKNFQNIMEQFIPICLGESCSIFLCNRKILMSLFREEE